MLAPCRLCMLRQVLCMSSVSILLFVFDDEHTTHLSCRLSNDSGQSEAAEEDISR